MNQMNLFDDEDFQEKFPPAKLYIRPVVDRKDKMLSIALCRTSGEILVDEHIIEHFDKHESGAYIRLCAQDMYPGCVVDWGNCVVVKG